MVLWISSAILGAMSSFATMSTLLSIQLINAGISFYEVRKYVSAVDILRSSLATKAIVKRDGRWQNLDAALLVPGDLVLLAAGSLAPADCCVNEGEIKADSSAMTGVRRPVIVVQGNIVLTGSAVTRGEVYPSTPSNHKCAS